VVISASELAGLEDFLELLRNADESAAMEEGIADVAAGRLHDEDDILADLRRRRDDA
jgi:predicted transcriptional regulator